MASNSSTRHRRFSHAIESVANRPMIFPVGVIERELRLLQEVVLFLPLVECGPGLHRRLDSLTRMGYSKWRENEELEYWNRERLIVSQLVTLSFPYKLRRGFRFISITCSVVLHLRYAVQARATVFTHYLKTNTSGKRHINMRSLRRNKTILELHTSPYLFVTSRLACNVCSWAVLGLFCSGSLISRSRIR